MSGVSARAEDLLGRLFVLTASVMSVTVGVLSQRHWLASEDFEAAALLLAGLVLACTALVVWFRKQAYARAAVLMCWGMGGAIVLRSATGLWMAQQYGDQQSGLHTFHAFLPFAIVVNFVFLSRWQAVTLSALTAIGVAVAGGWYVFTEMSAGHSPDLSLLDAHIIAPAAFVILMSVYSRLRQDFEDTVAARVDAETAAERDPLTQLLNRRGFDRRFAESAGGYGFAIVDVDHFKRFNDEEGHARGDEVLRDVAQCLRQGVRATDLVARWGGEEFVVRFERCLTDNAGLRAAEKLRSLIKTETGVTVSIGLVVDADAALSLDTVVKRADAALYGAKEAGRDRVALWDSVEADVNATPAIPEPYTADLTPVS